MKSSPGSGRRGSPKTLWVYGVSAGVVATTWAVLAAAGADSEPSGRIALAAIAAGAMAVAAFRDPFGLVCVLVAFLPFSLGVLQIEIGIVTLNPYTIGITGAAAFALFGAATGLVRYRWGKEDAVVLLLGAALLASTLRAKDVVDAGFLAFHGVFIPVMTYYAIKILVKQDDYRKIAISFILGVAGFALYGILSFIKDPARLYILSMPPISAAAMMASAVILLVGLGLWRKPLGLIAGVCLVVGLATTFSRGYLLLLTAAPFVYAVVRRGHAGKLIVVMMAVSLLATIALVQSIDYFYVGNMDQTKEQSADRVTDLDYWRSSLYGRAQYYSLGLEEFKKSPVIGNGFHYGVTTLSGRSVVWHNFHVEWLEYGGLLAYVLYAMLFVSHFFGMGRPARHLPEVASNLTAIFVILVNGLMNSFTAGISPVLGFLFLGMNGAATLMRRKRANER